MLEYGKANDCANRLNQSIICSQNHRLENIPCREISFYTYELLWRVIHKLRPFIVRIYSSMIKSTAMLTISSKSLTMEIVEPAFQTHEPKSKTMILTDTASHECVIVM